MIVFLTPTYSGYAPALVKALEKARGHGQLAAPAAFWFVTEKQWIKTKRHLAHVQRGAPGARLCLCSRFSCGDFSVPFFLPVAVAKQLALLWSQTLAVFVFLSMGAGRGLAKRCWLLAFFSCWHWIREGIFNLKTVWIRVWTTLIAYLGHISPMLSVMGIAFTSLWSTADKYNTRAGLQIPVHLLQRLFLVSLGAGSFYLFWTMFTLSFP